MQLRGPISISVGIPDAAAGSGAAAAARPPRDDRRVLSDMPDRYAVVSAALSGTDVGRGGAADGELNMRSLRR